MACHISIIIPTYKSTDLLKKCLALIEQQTYKKELFEVIVVNNDPDKALVLPSYNINLTVYLEKKKGSYAARNAGVNKAKGEILVFTDDDCMPSVNWLEEIDSWYSHERCQEKCSSILVGQVDMVHSEGIEAHRWNVWECYDYLFGINQDIYAKRNEGATANLSVSRRVFHDLGGFNDQMLSGGDGDFCQRAFKSGYSIKYDPSILVRHPLRGTGEAIKLKLKRLVGGKFKRNKYKSAVLSFAPPLVRLTIIFRKKAPLNVKLKAFCCLFYLKGYQVVYYFKLLLGFSGFERR
ncbi:glycosyltransferase [Idiomarina loihiensis]|uniref:glycosyltransferase family 2 protein n=1 Tax=Idiomarina loihiensis TaxID=135577 RepID=UPI00129CF203|nr:glycosyltransferase [Idiomarina loihiensis]MRJ45158.1 glycosyltransferase [Idiomarina loihiensis]UTW32131.1 glycosyltransferase [Idiomarina loihiensis]